MPSTSNIVDEEHGYAVLIPEQTPDGDPVTIETETSKGVHLLHAQSPDRSRLYFEITTFPELMSHDVLAAAQRRFLSERSENGQVSEPGPRVLGGHQSTAFDFGGTLGGDWRERRFLFIDGPRCTYRVVYDPTSTRNEEVLQSLTFAA